MALGAGVAVAVGEMVGKGVLVAGSTGIVGGVATAAGGVAVSVESAGVGAGFLR